MTSPEQIHIGVAIDGAGSHPAAWRLADADAGHLFDAGRVVALAQLAERGALDLVTLDDSFRLQSGAAGDVRGKLDALLTLARVAPLTTSIGLVPTVTTTHTEPFHISKNVATLDLVSAGRAGWLVDVSATETEADHFGRRAVASRHDLFDEAAEAIDVVRQLWDSWEDDAVIRDVSTGRYIDRARVHPTNFHGRFFSVRGPSITPRSPQAQPLVMIRANDEPTLAVGVQHADVIVVEVTDSADARRWRARVDAGVRAAGRDPSTVFVLALIDVLLEATEAAAQRTRRHLDEIVDDASRIPPPDGLHHTGSAEGLADLLLDVVDESGLDGFVVRPVTLPGTLRHIVDDLIPVLRSRGRFRTEYEGATLRKHFHLPRPANRYAVAQEAGLR